MVLLAASGPKLFINHTELLKNEFILWQEHNQVLVSEKELARPFDRIVYDIAWERSASGEVVGKIVAEGHLSGEWRARARDDRIEMTYSVTNVSDRVWPVSEVSFCYKHRCAVDFWNPDLDRTYVEWEGEPVTVRDRIRQMHGEEVFWPKNQLHLKQFGETCERYDRVGLKNPASAGWCVHRDGTTGGWMAIVSGNGEWLSGTFWEKAERVAQNGPDYGCIHAGLHIGYDIEPGETVRRKGTILISRMSPGESMEVYRSAASGRD